MSDMSFLKSLIKDTGAFWLGLLKLSLKWAWKKLSNDKQRAIDPLRRALDGLHEELIMHPKNAEQVRPILQAINDLIIRDISETEQEK